METIYFTTFYLLLPHEFNVEVVMVLVWSAPWLEWVGMSQCSVLAEMNYSLSLSHAWEFLCTLAKYLKLSSSKARLCCWRKVFLYCYACALCGNLGPGLLLYNFQERWHTVGLIWSLERSCLHAIKIFSQVPWIVRRCSSWCSSSSSWYFFFRSSLQSALLWLPFDHWSWNMPRSLDLVFSYTRSALLSITWYWIFHINKEVSRYNVLCICQRQRNCICNAVTKKKKKHPKAMTTTTKQSLQL